MTIKQQGGIFGRNPTFNDVDINGSLTTQTIDAGSYSISGGTINGSSFDAAVAGAELNLGVTGNTSVKYIKFNEATDWSIQSNGSSYLRFYSGGSEAARFDGSQNFSMVNGGNVIMASGSGIDFSATSGTGTSELFDDYEEGTWTPVLSDANSGGNTATLGSSTAHYVKVGSVVHLFLQVINVNNSGMTGGNTLYIQGLPYTSVSSNNSAGSAVFDRVSVSGFYAVTPAIGPTRDFMTLATTTTGAADGGLTVAAFNNSSSDIQNLHISYRA